MLVVVICIALVVGPFLFSRLMSNVGLAILARTFAQRDGVRQPRQIDPNATAAELWLRRAIELDGGNQGAWRGLGFVLALQGREHEAMTAWQNAHLTAQDFIEFGESARASAQYRTALTWYRRSLNVDPAAGIPRYYAGLVYEQLAEWGEALESYQQARHYADVQDIASSLYLRLGRIYQLYSDPPDLPAALALYDEAIALDRFVVVQERTEAHFQRGRILHDRGQPAEARREFEWVLREQPDHYWAHVSLGMLAWQADNDVTLAEAHLKQAISLRPDIKWAYRQLGTIYQSTQRYAEAIEMYRQAIDIDSSDSYVAQQLQNLTGDENK